MFYMGTVTIEQKKQLLFILSDVLRIFYEAFSSFVDNIRIHARQIPLKQVIGRENRVQSFDFALHFAVLRQCSGEDYNKFSSLTTHWYNRHHGNSIKTAFYG